MPPEPGAERAGPKMAPKDTTMTTDNPLIQSPPRLSDLRGDELTQALRARADRHRENWLLHHRSVPLITRIVERLFP